MPFDMLSTEAMNRVTYCGGYCGDCSVHNGQIRTMVQELHSLLKGWCYRERALARTQTIPAAKYYPEFEAVLEWIAKEDCQGCRAGGCTLWGDPDCAVRDCARERGLVGCWECADETECEKLLFLDHGDPTMPNNRQRMREIGPEAWIAEKMTRTR